MQVFYRKWRPQTLAQVVGQGHVTRTLLNALGSGRVAHAYLFCGPRGTGKTSTGRILAKAVNCLEGGQGEPCNRCAMCIATNEGRAMDVIEIDAASNRGIDEIRDLRERAKFAPTAARYKVYIIDEVHMLTEPAFNALLKTLEEPPPQVLFVLATTEPHKVPPTILSRCQRFDFRRISTEVMVARLAAICRDEGITIEEQSLKLIARSATGSLRDAENLLEQAVAHFGPAIGPGEVQAMLGISGDARVGRLARHIVERDIAAGLKDIYQVAQDGLDLRQFSRELVEHLRGLVLLKAGAAEALDTSAEALAEMKALAEQASMEQLSRATRLFRSAEQEGDGFSSLPLELAFMESVLCRDEEATPPAPAPRRAQAPAARAKAPARAAPPPPEATTSEKTPAAEEAIAPQREAAPPAPGGADGEGASVEGQPQGESGDIEHFRSRWREVVDATRGLGSKGNLDALLRSACEPMAIEGDTLVLGFYYAFHKEKIEDPKYRHMVEQKVSEVFGQRYNVRCVLTVRQSRGRGHLVDAALRMGAKIVEGEEE